MRLNGLLLAGLLALGITHGAAVPAQTGPDTRAVVTQPAPAESGGGLDPAVSAITEAQAESSKPAEPDDPWSRTAARAERVIDDSRASNAAFEKLRAEIAGYREGFSQARTQNSDRLRTLQAQLKGLGAVPESGEEPADIAALRRDLSQQMDNLRLPQVLAEQNFNRANGLINEIDRIIRERETSKLLSRGPSPLNPDLWPNSVKDFSRAMGALWHELEINAQSRNVMNRLNERLPGIVALLALGIVLIIRGPQWSGRLGDYLRSFGGAGSRASAFVVSLARIFLPQAGVIAIMQAVQLTGILGLRGELLAEAIPYWSATLLIFLWLATQLFDPPGEGLVTIRPQDRIELRWLVLLLAVMLVLRDAIALYERLENISVASRAVTGFPAVLMTSLLLLRLQRLLSHGDKLVTEARHRGRMGRALRRVAIGLGVLAPILAMLGYPHAAEAIVYPAALTLAVVAGVNAVQRFLVDLYGWATRTGDAARDTLFAALSSFTLYLVSMPILALVWGARVSDLTEIWSKFLTGFAVGGTRISPSVFFKFLLIFAVGYGLTRLVQSSLRSSVLPRTRIDAGGQNAILAGTGYVGIFLAALAAVSGAGLDLSSLAIVAGALSVGIGFGLQTIVSNFVSGIILLIERPVSKGDWIEVGGLMGYVRDISVRSTRIETFDRTDVIIPNSDLISGTVTNYTHGNTVGRILVPVGVGYGSDTRKVERVLSEIAEAHPMVLADPGPKVMFLRFGADALEFEIRAFLRDINWAVAVKSDINHEIARRFGEEGFEIPFAQRDIWLRNPQAFAGGGGGRAGAGGAVASPASTGLFPVQSEAEPEPDLTKPRTQDKT